MRKIVFLSIIVLGAAFIIIACNRSGEIPQTAATLYFADAEMNRLLPYDDELPLTDAEHMAKAAISKLIEGRDNNEKIRRLLPKDKRSVSVRVDEDIAYVDLKSGITKDLPSSRDIERLLIYQIVDTLTEIKGIRFVRFTIDGNVHKSLMGYFDMRETYKYQYPE